MSERGRREAVGEAIAATAVDLAGDVDSDLIVCTGWAVVAEWETADGQRWMTQLSDDRSPIWLVRGLMHEALYPGGEGRT